MPTPLQFRPCNELTLGVELELQILDRGSHDLHARASRLLELIGGERSNIKHELFESIIEINTGVCGNAAEARRDIEVALAQLAPACRALDLQLASAGTHAFAGWEQRVLHHSPRYDAMVEQYRWVATRLLIFGTHVHLGMRNGDHAIAMMNAWTNYLPHLLALSASSPYWQGQDTGLASCRATIFGSLPSAGDPCLFTSWREFTDYYDAAMHAGALHSVRDIWWDLRPHPDFGTLELRICDALPTLTETFALVGFIHALALHLDRQIAQLGPIAPPAYWRLRENKWRAARWGLDARLIVNERGDQRLLRDEIAGLIKLVMPAAAALGCSDELRQLRENLQAPPSYARQRRWLRQNGKVQVVAAQLAQEFAEDRPMPSAPAFAKPRSAPRLRPLH